MSGELGADQWECMFCTFHNSNMLAECGMCGSPKPIGGSTTSMTVPGEPDDAFAAAKAAMDEVATELKTGQYAYFKVSADSRRARCWNAVNCRSHHANAAVLLTHLHHRAGGTGGIQWGRCSLKSSRVSGVLG